ncbi:hypothetical protein QFC20_006116 [Naganishia adeliensis]|uniref:Uncharacterized protein n=1 Tax=Naganishia adeliensis TaxID=92952 RepID=A0ACC2VFR2_9TREE|nr:hypothetical protein QFC20_006116 [Naganishia adeliensis]
MSSTNEPSKVNGQIKSAVGTAEELLGNVIESAYQAVGGSSEPSQFTTAGKELHAKGEAEIKAAQAQGYVEGTADRIEGKKDSIVGAITGDRVQQASSNLQHDKGQAQQNINK